MSIRYETNLHFDKLIAQVEAAEPEALRAAAEHVMEVAVELTPLEEGTLRRSAKVTVDDGEAIISYDGPYARYQHEILTLRHEVGQAKFLESAVVQEGPKAVDIIATAIRRAQS